MVGNNLDLGTNMEEKNQPHEAWAHSQTHKHAHTLPLYMDK